MNNGSHQARQCDCIDEEHWKEPTGKPAPAVFVENTRSYQKRAVAAGRRRHDETGDDRFRRERCPCDDAGVWAWLAARGSPQTSDRGGFFPKDRAARSSGRCRSSKA